GSARTPTESKMSQSSCAEQAPFRTLRTHAEPARFARVLRSDPDDLWRRTVGGFRGAPRGRFAGAPGTYIKFNCDPTLAADFKRLHEWAFRPRRGSHSACRRAGAGLRALGSRPEKNPLPGHPNNGFGALVR